MRRSEATHFLNVDLDVYSRSNLEPFVTALGSRVDVLYLGRLNRIYETHLEISPASPSDLRNPNIIIQKLAAMIESLPTAPRVLWDKAHRREFSIGVQGGLKPNSFNLPIEPKTLAATAQLNARIVLTLYAHEYWLRGEKKK